MFFAGCSNDPDTVDEGTVRLIVNVSHHGYPISNAAVFRKNGTTIYPGADTTLYDARYVTDTNGNITFTDIGNGTKDVFLYAKGIDPTWDTTQITPVSGYYGFHIVTGIGEDKDVSGLISVSE
jgi:hypothetical protein